MASHCLCSHSAYCDDDYGFIPLIHPTSNSGSVWIWIRTSSNIRYHHPDKGTGVKRALPSRPEFNIPFWGKSSFYHATSTWCLTRFQICLHSFYLQNHGHGPLHPQWKYSRALLISTYNYICISFVIRHYSLSVWFSYIVVFTIATFDRVRSWILFFPSPYIWLHYVPCKHQRHWQIK